MSKDIDRIVENEREWRRHLLTEIRDIRTEQKKQGEDFTLFKGKALGFISVLVGIVEILKYKFFGK
jgi:hypothetical protein